MLGKFMHDATDGLHFADKATKVPPDKDAVVLSPEIATEQADNVGLSGENRHLALTDSVHDLETNIREVEMLDERAKEARRSGDVQLADFLHEAATEKLRSAIQFTESSVPSSAFQCGPADTYADMSKEQLREFQEAGGETAQDFAIAKEAEPSEVEISFTGLHERDELNFKSAKWTTLGCRKACRVLPGDVTAANSVNR